MKDSEALDLAAAVIEGGFAKDGYAKNASSLRVGVMSPDAKTFCLLGSLARVVGGSILEADRIAGAYVQPLLPKRIVPMTFDGFFSTTNTYVNATRTFETSPRAWNDEPERTQTQVAAKLREAAVKARQAGV